MDAESFIEVLVEEGYPAHIAVNLWKAPEGINGLHIRTLSEPDLREHARVLKQAGWIELYLAVQKALGETEG